MPSSKTRVAIIGCGVAGLVTARHVISRPEIYSLTVFEQTDKIGGTWVYTDETETDKNGLPVHSSMYKNLRTNLPKEIMQIPDFPFDETEDGCSFVHHSVIRKYLQDYTKHFNLYPYIKLNTLVNHVEPGELKNGQTIYTVSYTDLKTHNRCVKTYDAVILCNGHYTVPHVPQIPGSNTFNGTCLHSHQYRIPEKYTNKIVCILGASWSGIDICLEIIKYAKKIYLSHNLSKPIDVKMAKNVNQVSGIDHIEGDKFFFTDGTLTQIDVLIYCTGYEFTYPFVSSKIEIQTKDNHVEPVYKHLIHMDWPNFFLMGLPAIVVPFPMFHIQAQFILGVIEGRVKLPSPQRMREEYDQEKKSLLEKGISLRHINKMCDRQWNYYDEIAKAIGCLSFPPVMRKIYEYCDVLRKQDLMTYKNYRFKILDKDNFVATNCKSC